jgi:flagellar motor protein MotB
VLLDAHGAPAATGDEGSWSRATGDEGSWSRATGDEGSWSRAGGDEDSWSWLITFSDLVLQLFGFAIILAVGGAASGLAARDATPAAPVVAAGGSQTPSAISGDQANFQTIDDAARSAAPVARTAAPAVDDVDTSEPAGSAADSLPARTGTESDRDALPRPVARVAAPARAEAPAALPSAVAAQASVRDAELHALGRYLEQLAAREPALAATVRELDDAVVVRIGEVASFEPGRAEPASTMRPLLGELRALLAASPHLHAEVTGHTDDRPIHTAAFPSNLELSLARASRVAQELTGGDAALRARVSAAGFGEQRPVAPNADVEGRARNRRVEIKLSRAS